MIQDSNEVEKEINNEELANENTYQRLLRCLEVCKQSSKTFK